jgi:AcrR family transcriptional regulator
MSLREVGKNRRRVRILEAARQCIRDGGAENVSLKAIANAAELSVATLYNLFGSKEGILVALLVSSIESFRQRSPDVTSPAVRGRFDSLSAIAIDEFVSDEFFYRELIKSLSQMESRVHLSGLVGLSLDLGEPIVNRMIEAGELTEVVSPRVLSHHLFMGFVHAVQLWSSGVTSSAQFRTQVAHTQCLLLAGVATEGFRIKLHARLRELDEAMLEFSRQQPVSSEISTNITPTPATPGTQVAQGTNR